MADNLNALEDWAGAMLAKLSDAERSKLTRKIALELRRRQKRRITSQRNPDGTAFEPRKGAKKTKPAKPVRFIYKKPSGEERVADMGSWAYQGNLMVGYDREADGIRSFYKKRIVRFLTPGRGDGGTAIRSKRGRIKREAMFSKITSPRHLKAQSSANSVAIGFFGRTARLAQVHQYGLKDKPSAKAREVQYAERQLLGFAPGDLDMIRDMLLEHMAGFRA